MKRSSNLAVKQSSSLAVKRSSSLAVKQSSSLAVNLELTFSGHSVKLSATSLAVSSGQRSNSHGTLLLRHSQEYQVCGKGGHGWVAGICQPWERILGAG